MIDEKKWKYQQKYALYVNSKDMTVTVAIIADFFLHISYIIYSGNLKWVISSTFIPEHNSPRLNNITLGRFHSILNTTINCEVLFEIHVKRFLVLMLRLVIHTKAHMHLTNGNYLSTGYSDSLMTWLIIFKNTWYVLNVFDIII